MVVSDNGASGEGWPERSFNENKFFNNIPDTIEVNLARIDELGSPSSIQPLQHRVGLGARHALPVLEEIRGI